MNRPLVSAIIIFRDEERFLPEAVESVLSQDGPYWELLLVDDGSRDGSTAMARQYALQYPGRVHYLEHGGHANRGMSATRNLGLAHARGGLVAFLDADDLWLPGKLAEQAKLFTRHPEVALVYGRTLIWSSWDRATADAPEDFFYPLGVTPDAVIEPPRLAAVLIENKAQSPTTCNAMMRLDSLRSVGGFEDSFTGLFEDQAAFLRLMLSFPTYVSSRCWAKYRQHPESCTNRAQARRKVLGDYLRYLDWAEVQVKSRATDGPWMLTALRRKRREVRHPMLYALGQRLLQTPALLKGSAGYLLRRLRTVNAGSLKRRREDPFE